MGELSHEATPTANGVNKYWVYISKFLINLKVVYNVPNTAKRTYRVNGLGPTATNHRFEYNGLRITIEDYFRRIKNYPLRHPDLPCLWVGSKKDDKNIYLPAEVSHSIFIST